MDAKEQKVLFELALAALRNGRGEAAARQFRTLLKSGSKDPSHISYCGLAIATVEGKLHDGRVLCEIAARDAFYDPEMHLNLALVYEHGGRRTRAIESLAKGLEVDPNNSRLRHTFARLNRRARPILGFLPRDHPLNRYLGRFRARATRRNRPD
jgi:predicted Zn-dependent protease